MADHANGSGRLQPLVRRALIAIVLGLLGLGVIDALWGDGDGGGGGRDGDECNRSEDRLIRAAARHDANRVKSELEAGADPDLVVEKRTALLCAVEAALPAGVDQNEAVAAIEALLDGGADPDRAADPDRGLSAPLLLASEHGAVAMVEVLVERGADPNLVVDHRTALDTAIDEGHVNVTQQLLDAGADPNLEASRLTPLERAAGDGHSDIVRLLLDAGAAVEGSERGSDVLGVIENWRPLEWAAASGHRQVIDMLLDAGAELRPSVLRAAAGGPLCIADADDYQSRHDTVEYLLVRHQLDPDGDERGPSPLLCAAWSGNEALVDLLLDQGADPDHGGRIDPLTISLAFEVTDLPEIPDDLKQDLFPFVRDLQETADTLDEEIQEEDTVDNVPPLVGATWRGEAGIAEQLLDAGADPNLSIERSLNALFAAAVRDERWAVDLLLDNGAEPSPKVGSRPWTPAEVARELGNDSIANEIDAAID